MGGLLGCFGAFWALSSRLEARYPLSPDYDGRSQPLLRWGARVIFFSLGTNGFDFVKRDHDGRGGGGFGYNLAFCGDFE